MISPIEPTPAPASPRAGLRLFVLSFLALFLELLVIRWVPSWVRLIAYYANLMLISSFLGLGLGAMLSHRRWELLKWFQFCLAALVGCVLFCRGTAMPGSGSEARFFEAQSQARSFMVLLGIFVLNTAMFVPIGQEIGRLFGRLPPLRAYGWDLLGSLTGTLVFGIFSIRWFSPLVGFAAVVGIHTALLGRRFLGYALIPGVAMLTLLSINHDRDAIWSAYHYLTVHDPWGGTLYDVEPQHQTRMDPLPYVLRVNQDFYQSLSTVDPARYTPGTLSYNWSQYKRVHYPLPYRIRPSPQDVLVLGAGGGLDVEAALLAGATSVDAVDIDRAIVRLSRTYSATDVYGDPRVTVRVDDARAFIQRLTKMYDVVAFGYLDSQNLFSYGSSLRLDGYIYTVECFRRAFAHVREGGMLSVSFAVTEPWVAQKLSRMLHEATGALPIIYRNTAGADEHVMLVPRFQPPELPARIEMYELVDSKPLAEAGMRPATDDWPYLYLRRAGIPSDYALVIAVLLVLSVTVALGLRGTLRIGASDLHFFFLGWGFLLLQTKSIGDCSLYFGTTWVVSLIVISGTLLMVLVANLVAMRMKGNVIWPYLPLLGSLLLLILMPRETVLGWDFDIRLAWAVLIVPLPIFFAGLVFSTTFRQAGDPAACFGANLIGATMGGFCEYLGMWIGTGALGYIIVAVYLASLVSLKAEARSRRLKPVGAAV